jgi:hypothetical protein
MFIILISFIAIYGIYFKSFAAKHAAEPLAGPPLHSGGRLI